MACCSAYDVQALNAPTGLTPSSEGPLETFGASDALSAAAKVKDCKDNHRCFLEVTHGPARRCPTGKCRVDDKGKENGEHDREPCPHPEFKAAAPFGLDAAAAPALPPEAAPRARDTIER